MELYEGGYGQIREALFPSIEEHPFYAEVWNDVWRSVADSPGTGCHENISIRMLCTAAAAQSPMEDITPRGYGATEDSIARKTGSSK